MAINLNAELQEQVKIVSALAPVVPSSAAPRWVSLKNHERISIVLNIKNATTVTGSAIALSQATAVAGTNAKTLAFTNAYRNIDTAAGDTLSSFAVASNTFTTDATNSKDLVYVIEVKAEDLDMNGGFDCIRVTVGNATAATVSATYLMYGNTFPTSASSITD